MISKHCGVRLRRLTPDFGPKFNPAVHVWQCSVCKRLFKQRRRQKDKKDGTS